MTMENIIKGLVKGLAVSGESRIAEKVLLNAYMNESKKCTELLKEYR